MKSVVSAMVDGGLCVLRAVGFAAPACAREERTRFPTGVCRAARRVESKDSKLTKNISIEGQTASENNSRVSRVLGHNLQLRVTPFIRVVN